MATTTSILPSVQININYNDIKDSIEDFLLHFKKGSSTRDEEATNDQMDQDVTMGNENDIMSNGPKYMNLLQKVSNRELSTLYIDLDDIKAYETAASLSQGDFSQNNKTSIVDNIVKNTFHYINLFSEVVDQIMPEPTVDVSYKDDVLDVILHQRRLRNIRLEQEARQDDLALGGGGSGEAGENSNTNSQQNKNDNLFPPKLTRRYCLYFRPLSDIYRGRGKALAVREVKGSYVGQLITVRGIVTRVSDVKPSVLVNAYTCDKCGYEIFQEVSSRTFTPLVECTSPQCQENQSKGKLFMSTRASKFSAFQDVKIQELADQVPVGHIPRTLTIHVNGDLVRSMSPGDIVDVAGIFLPAPYTGFRALRAGLLTETYLEAQYVRQHKKKYENLGITPEIETLIEKLRAEGDVYSKLARSIAPEIFGHEDVKKALLLLLVGGVTKEIGDGMRIRGDINVCLMGDPGVAKSQLLKSISKLAPRAVYTTGKGSSGVGLTAAVMRDPITDEMVLEGGALVLADNGICCIDEFDKMEDGDRTAIHEVMEQQTISISKAGITTTLNARTSILAAANPLYGRYNPRLSPIENINLPAALLSRFDILFLMLDSPSREDDERLAQHVAYVHMHNRQPDMGFEPLESSTIRQYISYARKFRPVITKDVSDYIISSYIKMRKDSKFNENSKKAFSHTTPRTLLGIIRMSQALARIRFDNTVLMDDVDEALRLIQVSKSSLYEDDSKDKDDNSPINKIYHIIKDLYLSTRRSENGHKILNLNSIRERVISRGFTKNNFDNCIDEYQYLGVWQKIDDSENLMLINANDDDDWDADMSD
ncbi:hypothetical protein PACTADRAFT_55333 [Pachysolen tannophilus NRRL Y-2460]|uniref:DNA replication licensing factor MCM7 n=1 Tax=Pachysolen tannophilus NRRL Y-2460 TaxID=669874 RepID=A0A1E4TZA3_PACTA|nr:hypothetical protein PACTADRAFT_55333 [Pachysolen tannophilus NRRL Y-2460]